MKTLSSREKQEVSSAGSNISLPICEDGFLPLDAGVLARTDLVDELLTIAEVAAYLKLSRRTAWRWCKSGLLPAVKIGHQWRVARTDLEDFVQSQRKGVTP